MYLRINYNDFGFKYLHGFVQRACVMKDILLQIDLSSDTIQGNPDALMIDHVIHL